MWHVKHTMAGSGLALGSNWGLRWGLRHLSSAHRLLSLCTSHHTTRWAHAVCGTHSPSPSAVDRNRSAACQLARPDSRMQVAGPPT
jgi:hypothetical protein